MLACLAVLFLSSVAVRNVEGVAYTKMYVDPPSIVDYSKVTDTLFNVTIKIFNVTNLWAYQFNLTWDPILLDISNIYEGPFLQAGGTTTWSYLYDNGWITIAATLLGMPFRDSTPQSGNGVLFDVEFLVKQRGWTVFDLKNTKVGVIVGIELVWIAHNIGTGYFRNTLLGDADWDGNVDTSDLSVFKLAYGSTPGKSNWNSHCDFDLDGKVDVSDLFDIGRNYNKEV